MKKIYSFLLTFALLFAFITPAHAVVSSATSVRILFSGTTVDTSNWYSAVPQSAKAIKGMTVFSTSPVPYQLAIGASGSEVVQLVLPQGTLPGAAYNGSPVGTYNFASTFYPIPISQGAKIAIRALNSQATVGEMQLNFFYY